MSGRQGPNNHKENPESGPNALHWVICGGVLLVFIQLMKIRVDAFGGFYPVFVAMGCLMIVAGLIIGFWKRKR